MKIKLTKENADKINAELEKVNGKSTTHTYSYSHEIFKVVGEMENLLLELYIPMKQRKGAICKSVSGKKVANSYKYSRKATSITLERGAKEWFLTHIKSVDIGKKGHTTLILTQEQDEIAVQQLRLCYSIQPPTP